MHFLIGLDLPLRTGHHDLAKDKVSDKEYYIALSQILQPPQLTNPKLLQLA